MAFIETKDATRLNYNDAGRGKPLVFVASAWLSSRMWEFQVPHLVEAGLRCITLDRRGHGRSDWPWDGYDYGTLADDLATLIERLDLHDVTLVAHSAGGGEVVRYLTRHGSARIERIALISCTLPFMMKTADNPEGIDRAPMQADLTVRTADRPQWFADNAAGFFGLGLPGVQVSEGFKRFMIEQCLDCSARAAVEFFLSGYSTDFRSELRAIELPTLIVHGDKDLQAPLAICGRKTARLIPNNQLVVYENAAHASFFTHAARLNADLVTFAKGAARAPINQVA
jgi:non-heme chloroperoxidase